jgi:hypothetical protein
MIKILFVMLVGLGAVANADNSSKNTHAHGLARMTIAFDGKIGKLVVNAPSDMVYGFETQARSVQDKKRKAQGLQHFEDNIAEAIEFDPALKCEIKKDMFEVNQESTHADVEAEFRVTCQSAVAGSSIRFYPRKVFSRFKTLNVEIMADTLQKSAEIKKDGEAIEFQ